MGFWDDRPRPIQPDDWKGEPPSWWDATGMLLAAVIAMGGVGVWAVLAFLVER